VRGEAYSRGGEAPDGGKGSICQGEPVRELSLGLKDGVKRQPSYLRQVCG